MKYLFLTYTLFLLAGTSYSQDSEIVKWYSINDIETLLANEPRPVFIDAYTDWCGWCKEYDKKTFSDPVIARYLNENFYPVKFNAESNESVNFMGTEYINDGKNGKTHQLAVRLLVVDGRISYPTIVFLNEKGEYLGPVPGYNPPKDFEPLLVFVKEKAYQEKSYEDFMKTFKGSY